MNPKKKFFLYGLELAIILYLILSDQEIWLIPLIVVLVALNIVGNKYRNYFEGNLWRTLLVGLIIISVLGIGSYILITKVFGVYSLF